MEKVYGKQFYEILYEGQFDLKLCKRVLGLGFMEEG